MLAGRRAGRRSRSWGFGLGFEILGLLDKLLALTAPHAYGGGFIRRKSRELICHGGKWFPGIGANRFHLGWSGQLGDFWPWVARQKRQREIFNNAIKC